MKLLPKNEPIVAELSVYVEGIEVPGKCTYRKGKPPERTEGDIKGWSLSSRRRLRQFLMRHQVPEGWRTFSCDITIPPLPVGSANPCADRAETQAMFGLFRKRLDRIGLCMVWRMEVQPRTETKRDDIRGIEQAHWHCIGGCPASFDLTAIKMHWLACLGERAKVCGALERAANVDDCGDWQAQRLRYLFDHASKAKLEQVAVGWGKHWGVTKRAVWKDDIPEVIGMTEREQVYFLRFIKRMTARRVPDRRATGGIPWSVYGIVDPPEFEPHHGKRQGIQWNTMGASYFCEGWDGTGKPPHSVRLHLCKCLGAAKRNVWALKTGKCRRSAGQFFGVTKRVIECAKIVANASCK